MLFRRFAVLCLSCLCLIQNLSAADRVPELLKLLPDNVNSISIIRIDELMKSERAVKEQWKDKQEADFLVGSGRIPSWVGTLVRGTEIHALANGPVFSASVAPEPEGVSLAKLLPADQVVADQLGTTPIWRSPRGYIAEVKPSVVGLISPGNRQALSGWLRTIAAGAEPRYSSYLKTMTTKYQPHILYAIDLTDFFEPAFVASRVSHSTALAGKEAEAKALTAALLKLRGMRLAVDIDARINGAIAFDFSGPIGSEAQYLKPLLIEVLDDAGARIDEVEQATVKTDGESVSLVMPLSDASLRRLMTLILTPIPANPAELATPSKTPPKTVKPAVPVDPGTATKKYFDLVNNTVRDLQILNRRAKEYNRTATWHDNYARKIQDFPTTNVDPDAVAYGSYIASCLQSLASSLRGVPVQVQRLDNKVTYQVNTNHFWGPGGAMTPFGYIPAPWEVTNNIPEVRQAQQDAIDKSNDQREQLWAQMLDEKKKMADSLSKKYGLKFE